MTQREAWLLSWCIRVPGRSMLRMSTFGGWSLMRMHVMYRHGSERNPSEPEGVRLLRNGWVTLRYDPANYTRDTLTGETWPSYRAIITPKGRKALEEFHRENNHVSRD